MVNQITLYNMEDRHRLYLRSVVTALGKMHKRNLTRMSLYRYIGLGGRVSFYENENGLAGVSLTRLIKSVWDDTEICYCDLLWGETPRASFELMNDLIDFTRDNAEAMILARNEFTKIKHERFLKLGFRELETQYVWENLDE